MTLPNRVDAISSFSFHHNWKVCTMNTPTVYVCTQPKSKCVGQISSQIELLSSRIKRWRLRTVESLSTFKTVLQLILNEAQGLPDGNSQSSESDLARGSSKKAGTLSEGVQFTLPTMSSVRTLVKRIKQCSSPHSRAKRTYKAFKEVFEAAVDGGRIHGSRKPYLCRTLRFQDRPSQTPFSKRIVRHCFESKVLFDEIVTGALELTRELQVHLDHAKSVSPLY